MERPAALDPIHALELIHRLLAECGGVSLTRHARDRFAERRVTVDDVLSVLRNGVVSRDARWNEPSESWSYVVSGRDCDGASLSVVVAPDAAHCRLTIVTVMDTER